MVRLADVQAAARRPPNEFVKTAFPVDKRNARHVAPTRVRPTARGWSCATVTKVPGERARVWRQSVVMPRNYRGLFSRCPRIKFMCTCPRFVYVWNHALFAAGYAVRDDTNGQPAVETNPEGALGCCKHAIIIIRYLSRTNARYPHAVGGDGAPLPGAARQVASSTGRTVRLSTVRDTRGQ